MANLLRRESNYYTFRIFLAVAQKNRSVYHGGGNDCSSKDFSCFDALVQKSLSFRFLRSRNARMFCLSFKLITDRDVCHLFRVFSKLRYAFAVLKYEKPALRQISSKITTADIFFRNKLARGISWKKKQCREQPTLYPHETILSIFSLIRFSMFTEDGSYYRPWVFGSWRGVRLELSYPTNGANSWRL